MFWTFQAPSCSLHVIRMPACDHDHRVNDAMRGGLVGQYRLE